MLQHQFSQGEEAFRNIPAPGHCPCKFHTDMQNSRKEAYALCYCLFNAQITFTCSKSTTETREVGVKYVQS